MTNKIALVLVVFIFAGLLLAGCGGSESLVGKWKIEKAEGYAASMNEGTTYEFKADGTLLISLGSLSNEFTWKKTNDGEMDVLFKGKPGYKIRYEIKGDTLIYEITNSDQKFEMKKQK